MEKSNTYFLASDTAQIPNILKKFHNFMEEAKGFEPLNTHVLIVFKTIAFNRSATPPSF